MTIFGKNDSNINVRVSFNNFEKNTVVHELENGNVQKDLRINGSIDMNITCRGDGNVAIGGTRYLKEWIERIINRFCERDEKIAETNAKKS